MLPALVEFIGNLQSCIQFQDYSPLVTSFKRFRSFYNTFLKKFKLKKSMADMRTVCILGYFCLVFLLWTTSLFSIQKTTPEFLSYLSLVVVCDN